MSYQDAAGGRAKGKVAERFPGLDPASGEPGNRGNCWRDERVRRRRGKRRSPKVEEVERGSHHRDEDEKRLYKNSEYAEHRCAASVPALCNSAVRLCYRFLG